MLQNKTNNNLNTTQAFNNVVLESSPDCLKVLDTQGRLQFMNYNGLCQMEIDDFSMFKNQLWWDLWGEENKDQVRKSVQSALQGEATEFTAYCETAKGTPKWWHVMVTPVKTEQNGVYQILSVSRDITELKEAQEKISNLNDLLEEKVRIRTEELLEKNIQLEKNNTELAIFNRIASHDLQEPLRKIQLFTKRIIDSIEVSNENQYNFNRIFNATDRMRNLIDAVHKFSVSKNATIELEDCNLNTIVSDVTDYWSELIKETNSSVDFKNLPTIKGSNILITQLFVNIIENAIKYSRPNVAPQIKISHQLTNSDTLDIPSKNKTKNFHKIIVEDNGIGFEDKYKFLIFEAFQRLHSKDQFLGTGIGLAICKTILEKHNGWIEATSIPDVGSKFTLYFPEL